MSIALITGRQYCGVVRVHSTLRTPSTDSMTGRQSQTGWEPSLYFIQGTQRRNERGNDEGHLCPQTSEADLRWMHEIRGHLETQGNRSAHQRLGVGS